MIRSALDLRIKSQKTRVMPRFGPAYLLNLSLLASYDLVEELGGLHFCEIESIAARLSNSQASKQATFGTVLIGPNVSYAGNERLVA